MTPITASLCVSISLGLSLPPSTFSVTRALSLPPSRSSCPCSLTVSSLTAGWREADARVYLGAQAPASTTLLSCSALWREGLGALKVQCTLRLACTPLHYLFSRRLSSLCHSSIEDAISLLNHHEFFLCRQLSLLRGPGVQKSPSLIYKFKVAAQWPHLTGTGRRGQLWLRSPPSSS